MPNRFFKLRPVTFDNVELYEPDFDLLNQSLSAQQTKYDNLLAGTEKLRDLIPKGGYRTQEAAKSLSSDFTRRIDEIVDELSTTGNIPGGDRAILNLARSLKDDPRYRDAVIDEEFTPNVHELMAKEEYADAIQDYYDPSTGFSQYTPSKTSPFNPAEAYKTIFPSNWGKGYAQDALALIDARITEIEPYAQGINVIPTYDENGVQTGSKTMITYVGGKQTELTEAMVDDLFNRGLGDVFAESGLTGEPFRQAQYEKLTGRKYDRQPKLDDIKDALLGKYKVQRDLTYSREVASQSKASGSKTKEPSVNSTFDIIGDINAPAITQNGIRVNKMLVDDKDGTIKVLNPESPRDKVKILNNATEMLNMFMTGDDPANGGLFGFLKAQGVLGDENLGLYMKDLSGKYTLSNYFSDDNELGYLPLATSHVAESPELRTNMKKNLKYADGTDVPDDLEDIELNKALHKADQFVGQFNEALRVSRKADQGIRQEEERRIAVELESTTNKEKADLINQYGLAGIKIYELNQMLKDPLQGKPAATVAKAGLENSAKFKNETNKRIEVLKSKRLNAPEMESLKREIVSGLGEEYFPPRQEPVEYTVMTFLPGDISDGDLMTLSTTDILKNLPKSATVEARKFAGLIPSYNKETKEWTQARETEFYQFTPFVDGEVKNINYKAGVALTKQQQENVIGVQPVGFTMLADGRYALTGRPVYKDGVIDKNQFILDNGRDEFTREMAAMFGSENPVFYGNYFMNAIENQELKGVQGRYARLDDKGLIPGAELSIRKARDIDGNQWHASIKNRDGKILQFSDDSAYGLASQITPFIKAGNMATFSSDINWNNMQLFNPDNEATQFDNTTIDFSQVENPALERGFYNEYKKLEAGFPSKVVATGLLRSFEMARELGNESSKHVEGKGMDLQDNPVIVKHLQDLIGPNTDITKGFKAIPGTNLKVLRHKNHGNDGYHIHIEAQ